MPSRKSSKAQPPPRKEWNLAEIDRGIEKLKKRISDVKALASDQVNYDDGRVESVKSDIVQSIEDVFGTDSREHQEHRYVSIHKGGHFRAGFHESRALIEARSQRAFQDGIPDTVTMLEGLIRRLEEKKEELFPSIGRQSATHNESAAQSIEQRLERLADLKSKGLISEQEYTSRREKILDEI